MIEEGNSDPNKFFPPLIEIYKNPKIVVDCIGVIVDSTWAYRTKTGEDYVTKIKLIDPSLNIETNLPHEKKYLHIFVYSQNKDLSPNYVRIGDIILLKNYQFSNYQADLNEVKGKRLKKDSCYYIFGYEPENDLEQITIQWTDDAFLKVKQFEEKYLAHLKKKLNELKGWSRIFFSNHSITKMNWFEGGARDYDIMLRIKSITELPEKKHKIFTFEDKNGLENKMSVDDSIIIHELKPNDVVKIRSIKRVQDGNILFNNFSAILKLPEFSLDFDNFMGASSKYKANTKIKSNQENAKEIRQVSLDTLLQLKNSIENIKSVPFKTIEHLFYETKGIIIDLFPFRAANLFRKYCPQCHLFQDLSSPNKLCCQRNLRILPVYSILLKDSSIEFEPLCLEVVHFPFDDYPTKSLMTIKQSRELDKADELAKMDLEIEKARESLLESLNSYRFLLQPLNDRNTIYYRIVEVSLLDEKEMIMI